MSHSILYRRYEPRDRERLLALFRAVYGDAFERRTAAWRYLDQPWRGALITVAEADGLLVGAQPSHEIPLQIGKTAVRGALLLDVMTHPAYRRRGVFFGVVELLRRLSHEEGLRLLLTTPNLDAARGFGRLSAWRCLGSLVPLVYPLDLPALIAGGSAWRPLLSPLSWVRRRVRVAGLRDGGVRAEEGARAELVESVAALWGVFSRIAPCMIVRDDSFLRWRFAAEARHGYRFHTRHDGPRCAGLAVTAQRILLGREVLMLAELMVSPDDRPAVRDLVRRVLLHASSARASAVVAYFPQHSPLSKLLRSEGFFPFPRFMRPRDYTIWTATDLEGGEGDSASQFTRWHMSLADSDLG